jgi:hypothetical protein
MSKKFLVIALALVAFLSFNAHRANAQSCQTRDSYGVRAPLPVDKSLQSQIEVTYFTTNDPNVFISEKLGLKRSASYMNLKTDQFVAKLDTLQREGVASIRKRQSTTSYLGEVANLNLERNATADNARMVNASFSSNSLSYLSKLNRETEVSVYKGNASDGDYYRLSVLSWFVDVTARGGQKALDYDAIVLLKPGQTAIFKLRSDNEMKRSGEASYVAITMRSVNNVGLASLRRSR